MIRVLRPAVAMSVQDQGRFGHRATGHARSGAMDPLSLRITNAAAGAPPEAAGVELGPGPCSLEFERATTVAFGGAERDGAPWWQTIEFAAGDRIDLGPGRKGVWSYVCVAGGVAAATVLGSRSASVREGIGAWIAAGDVISAGDQVLDPVDVEAPSMRGAIRVFGELSGSWRVGTRCDRLGYMLDGEARRGSASEWSEPLLPGFIQITPSGAPIVIMPEGPTVGGYPIAAVVHSDDLRLVAQTRTGDEITFIPSPS